MNNDFEMLKKKTKDLIENGISNNEKGVLKYINTILEKFGSKLSVRKNMSIGSFENLLYNSNTIEDLKTYLDMLDINKDYEIDTLQDIKEAIHFNEVFYKDKIKEYEEYKKFLDSRIKLNDNLFIIEYPKN